MNRPWLDEVMRQGAKAWPGLELSAQAVAEFLERHPAGDARRAADLYLAAGCAANDAAALRWFDQKLLPQAVSAAARIDPSPDFLAEVQQALRTKLFLGVSGRPPKIRDYAGKGPLAAWLRAAVVRTALNLRQGKNAEVRVGDEQLSAVPSPSRDLEIDLLRKEHGPRFARAFRASLAELADRDRTVLRMYLLEGQNVDRIGLLFRVNRTTVTRWMMRAREELLRRTLERLSVELRLGRGELESLVRVLRSELEVSLTNLVREGSP